MSQQKTIKEPATVQGPGLFSGAACRLTFSPAPRDTGVVFVRSDQSPAARIPCDVARVSKRARRTSLSDGTASVETVEHVLAAVSGLGIDNLSVELSAAEKEMLAKSAKAVQGVIEIVNKQS